MIVRQICMRQGRQLLGLNRQAHILRRFNSTDTTTATLEIPGSSGIAEPTTEVAKEHKKRINAFKRLGTAMEIPYKPNEILYNPPSASDITLELLLASQTHLGHSTSRWNPQNSRYIFGIREGVHIISLDITAAHLRRAAKVVEGVAHRGGLILFVGTRKGQKQAVVRAATLAKGYHIFERWIPGSLTNSEQLLGKCEKKVVNGLDEELPEYKEVLLEKSALKPDLAIVLNPLENTALLHECGLNNVPTIGIIDTDADATKVTYPIPANDDSQRSVELIAGVLGRAGEAGQKRRLEEAKRGSLAYTPVDPKDITSAREEEKKSKGSR
ncbi:ribosomal protein S2, flavodoxin-like domain-containing protein [Aspergillus karnatakaensis]|uniref:mitochondrial 37S ribosomal protein uS2m n=1 Tax=Aspergillus karnatakaensis TaxID=1810916 RepID=UPI003CCCC9C0